MLKTLQRAGQFWYNVIRHFLNDECSTHAAALTFNLLLSLVPVLTVSFTIFTYVPWFNSINQQLQNFIFAHFIPSSAEIIQQYLQQFITQTSKLSWLGMFFLFVTAILTLYNIDYSFNVIWKIKNQRSWWQRLSLYLILLIFVPVIFGLSFIVSEYLSSLPLTPTVLIITAPFLFSTIAFILLYKIMPIQVVPWAYCFAGGLTAAILFEIAKYSFAWYLIHFPTYELLYGALAAIPIFLAWLYICWLMILFGAEVCYTLEESSA